MTTRRLLIATLVFALVAAAGIAVSLSAPYRGDGDEIVDLTGQLQAHQALPDPQVVKQMDFGPYLYPRIMYAAGMPYDFYLFKSLYLILLIFSIGFAGYAMYRLLGLSFAPALALAVALLMPRFSSGLEVFGAFTFHEAIGRMAALPLFLVATAFLLRRIERGRPLWPVFLVTGLFVFMHPVTVTLFAFVSLVTLFIVRVVRSRAWLRALKEAAVCGIMFTLGGAYFFIDVFSRLSHGASAAGVSQSAYVQAVYYRMVWEYPRAVIHWFPSMFIVSFVPIALISARYLVPAVRRAYERHVLLQRELIFTWGVALALASLALAIVIPGGNLYAMEHWHAPDIFQQWSRIAKFYFLGVFIAVTPVIYALWGWYRESAHRYRHALAALAVLALVACSSFGFEVAQFVVGYKNFEASYVPQAFSHVPDAPTPRQYEALCARLRALGGGDHPKVISDEFALRFFCQADLYVTYEEGSAYLYLSRASLIGWHSRELAQRAALSKGPAAAAAFARAAGADFIVVPSTPRYASYRDAPGATSTEAFIVLDLARQGSTTR